VALQALLAVKLAEPSAVSEQGKSTHQEVVMDLENIFDAIEEMREKANVSAVYGEPVQVGERTIIPVADIKYGFGLGYGEGSAGEDEEEELETRGQGGGTGGGVAARPVAVIEVSDEGVQIKSVTDEGRIALAGIFTGVWLIFWTAVTLKAIFGKN
jgi:uncharacterized spore protein YtfJ